MRVNWEIEPRDIQEVRNLFEAQSQNEFVRDRRKKNLAASCDVMVCVGLPITL
jgi:hypothetical protein